MLSVVTWLWKPSAGYRSKFSTEHVNILRAMVARHYQQSHRFICVTDVPKGLDPSIEVIPDFRDFTDLASPHGGQNPSCYRRLRAFHPAIAATFGQRFVCLDLDTVVTGDLTPLWNRQEEFIAWKETNPKNLFNGSMFMLTAGSRAHVWERFDPRTSPKAAFVAGRFGSDQAILSFLLSPTEATWTTADGIYSYNVHLRRPQKPLPADARMVMWHGGQDPWGPEGMKLDWVKEHYRA